MSLIHWWPLVKDNIDYGITGNTSFSGDVITNGKLGQCRKVTNSTAQFSYNQLQGKSISYAGWFKFNKSELSGVLTTSIVNSTSTTPTGNLIGNCSYGGIGLCWCSNNIYSDREFTTLTIFGYARNSSQNIYRQCGVFTVEFDVWYHVAMIADRNNEKFIMYINGQQYGQIDTLPSNIELVSADFWTNVGWVYGGNGPGKSIPFYVNDLRVYDHALSQKEIKEMSKGLVLHYNFEDPYIEGTTNLITLPVGDGGWYWGGSATVTNEIITSPNPALPYKQCYKTTYVATESLGGTYNTYQSAVPVEPSTTYAYSAYIKTNMPFSPNMLYRYEYDSNMSYITEVGIANEGMRENLGDGWFRYYGTFTTQSNTRNLTLQTFNYPGGTGTFYRYVCAPQLEKKDHATPYVNGTRPSGIVYDNSGYGYNATIVGDCQIIPESKSGNYSLFNNSINIGTSTPTGAAYVKGDLHTNFSPNQLTISYWAKVINYSYQNSGILTLSADSSTPSDYQANGVHQYDSIFRFNGSSDTGYINAETITEVNVWHLYTLVYDGTSLKSYRDGVIQSNTSYSLGSINSFRYIYLGLNVAGGAWRQSKENWGDFKIYSTALSAEDIILEYTRKASLDKNGNLFAPYFKENTSLSNIKLNKNGIFNVSNFAENITLEDGSIWTPIVVHNVNGGVFSSISPTYVYNNAERWNSFGTIGSIERPESGWYEFLVMHQTEINGQFKWFRFKQNVNPLSASWSQVNPSNVGGNVVRIGTNSTWSVGAGMYYMGSSSCPMCFANNYNGNWWGCGIGANYEGGIPSYNEQVAKGFQLVYMRTTLNTKMKQFKNALLKVNNIIEN